MLQAADLRRATILTFRHWGALGLFFLCVIDSSPVPTFCGPDLLTIVLVTTRPNPWWEYPAMGTLGSVIGAYLTYRLGRKAGQEYLEKKFGKSRVERFLDKFRDWRAPAIFASSAVPFPFPTSLVFAAAGVLEYNPGKFLTVVFTGRAVRYTILAYLAHLYGRRLGRILLHPGQHWGWLLLFAGIIAVVVAAGFFHNRSMHSGHTAPAR